MKQVLIIGVVLLVALGVYWQLKPEPPLEAAKKAEVVGDSREALDQYALALLESSQSMSLPDRNRAKVLEPGEWFAHIEDYYEWITANETPAAAPAELREALAGIGRCTTEVQRQILLTKDTTATLSPKSYALAWRRAFFPANLTVEGNHAPLIERAVDDSLSLLRIESVRDFSYNLSLLDMTSLRRTDFFLYPESDVSVLLRPGRRYMLIGTSEVTFANGQYWRSPYNVLMIAAPPSPSLISLVAKTRVTRQG
jgi:hypothetical protein